MKGKFWYLLPLLLFGLNFPVVSQSLQAPAFSKQDTIVSHAGHFRLDWSNDGASQGTEVTYRLEMSQLQSFDTTKLIYKGIDKASFITGLPNGLYYYRVKAITPQDTSSWSGPAIAKVEHHSRQMAYGLFFMGMLVFLCTAGVVIHGVRHTSVKEI